VTSGQATVWGSDRREDAALRVATFNIHHGAGLDGRVDLERIARAIGDTGAEVVGLQEVDRHFHERSGFVDQAAWLAERLGADLAFGAAVDVDPLSPGEPRRQYGNAVVSAHPIRSSVTVTLPRSRRPERRVLLEALVTVRGVSVHVVATHLQNRAPDERRAQARAVRDHVAGAGGPVVVLADLNARPHAAEVATLTDQLVDAWDVAGAGPGHTFDAGTPHARIDYVLVSPGVTVRSAAVVPTDASDHRPVVADLAVPGGWQTAAP
jgi:endonuclease/exonuclease/phosphatase family metal-dependent hydrolase